MFATQIIDVAIGIVLVYFLISLICSSIREAIEGWMKTRAVFLERGIRALLNDPELARDVYKHPLIDGLFPGNYETKALGMVPSRGKNLPSYIPSKNFATALLDIAARGPMRSAADDDSVMPIASLDAIRTNVAAIQSPAVRRVLLTAIDTAQGDLKKVQANLAAWFDSGMDRVSGLYKRCTQWIIFLVAVIVTGVMNVNTITIAEHLYRDDQARAAAVAAAEKTPATTNREQAEATLEALRLPIGWKGNEWHATDKYEKLRILVGLLMTAFAASLGAPFWFDVLNKFMVIRSTVKPHEKSREEGSEDRQAKTTAAPTVIVNTAGGQASSAGTVDGDELDASGIADGDPTSDEQLPEAKGGVE